MSRVPTALAQNRVRQTEFFFSNFVPLPRLQKNTTDDDLRSLCQSFGAIVSTKVIVDRVGGHCKGYGFVMFQNATSAQLAVQALSGCGIQVSARSCTSYCVSNVMCHLEEIASVLLVLSSRHKPLRQPTSITCVACSFVRP
jgi:RNA recognition motif-containing protein